MKWGNSLAVRIPRSVAAEVGVTYGANVEVSVEDGAMVVRPAPVRPSIISLEKLVRKINKTNVHVRVGTRIFAAWSPPLTLQSAAMLAVIVAALASWGHGLAAWAKTGPKDAVADLSKCPPQLPACRYDLAVAQRAAGDAAGADATEKLLRESPLRDAHAVYFVTRKTK